MFAFILDSFGSFGQLFKLSVFPPQTFIIYNFKIFILNLCVAWQAIKQELRFVIEKRINFLVNNISLLSILFLKLWSNLVHKWVVLRKFTLH